MINNVVLVGRIAHDLELQTTANGHKLVKFSLAVDGDKKGAPANFIPCTVWGDQAELMNQFVGKGSMIGVEGRISVHKYETDKKEKRSFTEIKVQRVKFLDSKPEPKEKQQVSAKDSADWLDSLI